MNASFAGLPYFPIDQKYRVPAYLKADPKGEQGGDRTADVGTRDALRRVGKLGFTIAGTDLSLTAFSGVDDGMIEQLFVPFGDETSGRKPTRADATSICRTATGLYDSISIARITHRASTTSVHLSGAAAGKSTADRDPRRGNPALIPAVVFDFDGVLADTERVHLGGDGTCSATRLVAERSRLLPGLPRLRRRRAPLAVRARPRDRARRADAGPIVYEKAETSIAARRRQTCCTLGRPLRRPGRRAISVAIASASLAVEIHTVLAAAGLTRFPAIVGTDDVSRTSRRRIPTWRPWRALGVPPSEAVAIEDSRWGLDSAREAGLRTLASPRTTRPAPSAAPMP